MRLDIHVHHHWDSASSALLDSIHHKVGQIMTKLSELEGKLGAVQERLGKISGETGTLVQQVADLKAQLADQDLPPGAEQKLAEIEATAQRIDDAVEDPTVPPSGEDAQPSNG
jgi:chromosome segregation ATPase